MCKTLTVFQKQQKSSWRQCQKLVIIKECLLTVHYSADDHTLLGKWGALQICIQHLTLVQAIAYSKQIGCDNKDLQGPWVSPYKEHDDIAGI